jgi:hypothetical protein
VPDYFTWYELNKDLEREAGRSVLNAQWLRVKPAAPLPWTESHLRCAPLRLKRRNEEKPKRLPARVSSRST